MKIRTMFPDLPSSECSVEYLKESNWWEGSLWSSKAPEFWPKEVVDSDFEIVNSERRKTVVTATNV